MSTQPPHQVSSSPGPLTGADPAKVGDFWLEARLTSTPAGCAYSAHDDAGNDVMVILTSAGAAEDAAARARLAGEVNKLHIDTVIARGGQGQDEGRLGHRYRADEDNPDLVDQVPTAPWVALAFDGSPEAIEEAHRILTAIDLSTTPQLSQSSGPDYHLHWIEQDQPGPSRLWPLPWPGRGDRSGWRTLLASWLLMLLLSALAVLVAIVIFQNFPPQSPPPPVPTQATGSGNGSASPQSPGSNQIDPSQTPVMESQSPGGTASGQGTPTPNRKL